MDHKTIGRVYGLRDPRTGRTHYVGETTQTIMARLGGHIQNMLDGRGSTAKNLELKEWIVGLIAAGLSPVVYQLEEIQLTGDAKADKRSLWDAEQRWKKELRRQCEPLLNRVPGVKKGFKFADGTGAKKLRGRKRPELAAKLTGRTISDEHRGSLSEGQAGRAQRLKASGEWDSPEQRAIRSDKVRAAWATRRLTPESDGTRERRRQGQLRRYGKLPSAS